MAFHGLLCLELGRLATRPTRGLRDRTPAPPPALTRRRPEYELGGDDGEGVIHDVSPPQQKYPTARERNNPPDAVDAN